MRYLLLLTLIITATVAQAETAQAKIDALNALPNVLQANYAREPQSIPFFGELYTATVGWYYTTNGVAEKSSAELIIVALGTPQEAAYWLTATPAILVPVVETKYLTSRTVSGWGNLTGAQQKTAIEGFCNDVYKGATGADGNIREFSVTPAGGSMVKVSGYFDLGTTWEHQTWYVRLLDANGSVAAPYSNVEFQRVVEATAGIGAQAMAEDTEKYAMKIGEQWQRATTENDGFPEFEAYYQPGISAWEESHDPRQPREPSEPNPETYEAAYAGIIPGHPLAW